MTKGIKHKDIGGELTRTEFEADDSHELDSGTSFPGSPVEKDRFYRTDEHKWYIYNGSAWKLLTMPTVAIVPGSSAYPAGYHAGDGGGLSAIDADLVAANIKAGQIIFGVVGGYNALLISGDIEEHKIYLHTGITSTITTSFNSPANYPTEVTYDGTNLISIYMIVTKIYVHSGITSTITTSFNSPAAEPYGLTYDGANLISSSVNTNKIYIHSGITSSITTSFNAPGESPSGLTYDGTNLISSDYYDLDSIYIHSGITSTITTSFSSPSTGPTGLAYDGVNLISGDSIANKIYIHSGITSTVTTSFNSPLTDLKGLCISEIL